MQTSEFSINKCRALTCPRHHNITWHHNGTTGGTPLGVSFLLGSGDRCNKKHMRSTGHAGAVRLKIATDARCSRSSQAERATMQMPQGLDAQQGGELFPV